jgi:hypothetical protein
MKMYWGSGGITPRILDLSTRLGGPQNRSGRGGLKRKIHIPCRDSNPRSSSPEPSALPLAYSGAGRDAVARIKYPTSCRKSSPGHPSRSLVIKLTELHAFCPSV